MKRLTPLLLTALLIASCANDPDFEDPQAIAEALRGSGMECEELTELPGDFDNVESNTICVLAGGGEIQIQIHKQESGVEGLLKDADLVLEGTGTAALLHARSCTSRIARQPKRPRTCSGVT
jgi:hypothetical protein